MAKEQLNARVSALTRRQLDELGERWGTTQTETLTVIIDRMYKQEITTMSINEYTKKQNEFVREQSIRTVEGATSYGYSAYGHVMVKEENGIYRVSIHGNDHPDHRTVHGLTKDQAVTLVIENMTIKEE